MSTTHRITRRTKIAGLLLATAALTVGAGAMPATAEPAHNSVPVTIHLHDGARSVMVGDPSEDGGCQRTSGVNGTVHYTLLTGKPQPITVFRDNNCGRDPRKPDSMVSIYKPMSQGFLDDIEHHNSFDAHWWGVKYTGWKKGA
jgi:hypothetical protein